MSIQALYTACTGMNSMQAKLDVIANNLANTETTAFKADRPNFEDLFYRQEKYPAPRTAAGPMRRRASRSAPAAACRARRATSRKARCSRPATPSTWQSKGRGFSRSRIRRAPFITRVPEISRKMPKGSSSWGRPTSAAWWNRRSRFPPTPRISPSARQASFTIKRPAVKRSQQAGTIQLANFVNPQGLLKIGENLYQETEASGTATTGAPGASGSGLGTLQQGSLEQSNVDPVSSLIDLITTQRAFEMNSQTIQAGNECWQTINNLIK